MNLGAKTKIDKFIQLSDKMIDWIIQGKINANTVIADDFMEFRNENQKFWSVKRLNNQLNK